ncbi:TPA: hypothetical protein NKZ51_004507 [Vibrio parahaemolyticus]|nr:hypothetical protein [Vibrio parahaemolyticus]
MKRHEDWSKGHALTLQSAPFVPMVSVRNQTYGVDVWQTPVIAVDAAVTCELVGLRAGAEGPRACSLSFFDDSISW